MAAADMLVKKQLAHLKHNEAGGVANEDAFYVADLGDIVNKYKIWTRNLPRVQPFYAVKCNDEPRVLAMLAHLGTGFDCASKNEIERILEFGVEPKNVIFANTCKQRSFIKYAAEKDVTLLTFDTEGELQKIKEVFPKADLVIRILTKPTSKFFFKMSEKFGVPLEDVPRMLEFAKSLGLNVVGVSFHIGSPCNDTKGFCRDVTTAVRSARSVFEIGESLGFRFHLLDMGGGYPGVIHGDRLPLFEEDICRDLRATLDEVFPESMGVRIIAEPGTYFVQSAFTLVANIIAKRVFVSSKQDDGQEENGDEVDNTEIHYYLNDGAHGSFINSILGIPLELYDNQPFVVDPERFGDSPKYRTTIWGPTCDPYDVISRDCSLPELQMGDWIIFKNMGAYTLSCVNSFNGMPKSHIYWYADGEKHG